MGRPESETVLCEFMSGLSIIIMVACGTMYVDDTFFNTSDDNKTRSFTYVWKSLKNRVIQDSSERVIFFLFRSRPFQLFFFLGKINTQRLNF